MSRIYVILDTNVVVSGMLDINSVCGIVLSECLKGFLTPVLNAEILKEYVNVLTREKFNFSEDLIQQTITGLLENSISVEAIKAEIKYRDPTDIVFYEVTLGSLGKGFTESYLVTGNKKHFPKVPFVVSPAEMVEFIQIEKSLM